MKKAFSKLVERASRPFISERLNPDSTCRGSTSTSFHFRVCEMPEGRYHLQLANADGFAYLVSDVHPTAGEVIQIGHFLAQQTGLRFEEIILR